MANSIFTVGNTDNARINNPGMKFRNNFGGGFTTSGRVVEYMKYRRQCGMDKDTIFAELHQAHQIPAGDILEVLWERSMR